MDTPRLPFKIPIKNGRLRSTDCWPGDIRHTSQRRPDPRRSTFFCGIVFRAPPTTSAGKNQGRLHMAGTWAPLEWPLCVCRFSRKKWPCVVWVGPKNSLYAMLKKISQRGTHTERVLDIQQKKFDFWEETGCLVPQYGNQPLSSSRKTAQNGRRIREKNKCYLRD